MLKTAREIIEEGNIEERKIVIREDRRHQGEHERRYNIQKPAEVAILMANDPTENRDISIRLNDGHLKRVPELHPGYDPVLFPYGTDGYHIYMQGRNGRNVTQQQYYCFHMMDRESNYMLQGARLFQQYLVDAYCKIEGGQLYDPTREPAWHQMEILAKSARGWCSQLHTQVVPGICTRSRAMPWPTSDAWEGLTYSSQLHAIPSGPKLWITCCLARSPRTGQI